jgi:hypothetical protein
LNAAGLNQRLMLAFSTLGLMPVASARVAYQPAWLGTKVTLKGVPEIEAALKAAPEKFWSELTAAVNVVAAKVQRTAKMNAPVGLGRLRASIVMRPAVRAGAAVRAEVNAGANYAYFIETGLGRSGRSIERHLAPIAPEYARLYGLVAEGGKAHDREVYFMWVNIRHQPFLFPALEAMREPAHGMFVAAAKRAMAQVKVKK